MPLFASSQDFQVLKQHNKVIFAKIEILTKDMQTIDDIKGAVIDGSFSIDAESDIRRTLNITIAVTDSSFNISDSSKIWYDKFVKISTGYLDNVTEEILWYKNGVYVLSDGGYDWSATTSTLSLSCLDLAAWCDGTRNGYVRGLVTKIEEGEKIRNVLIKLITQEAGLSRYRIDTYHRSVPDGYEDIIAEFDEIPYDMEFDIDESVWGKITQIRDLYPGWEAFFDIDGTFVFQAIPTCAEDEVVLTSDILKDVVQSEPMSISFTEIYNVSDVYGQCIEADRFADKCTVSGNVYNMTMTDDPDFDGNDISLNTKIQVIVSGDSLDGQKITFNGSKQYPILYESGEPIKASTMKNDKTYVLKYRAERDGAERKNERMLFLGEPQVHAICKEVAFKLTDEQKEYDRKEYENCENIKYIYNPDSPFAITEMWSESHKNDIRHPLSGGEYENIYSAELALQRAEYETWLSTRLEEQTEFPMIAVPWLDVNQKIEYTSMRTGETKQYITKSISCQIMTGVMQVQAIQFYPLYPFIITQNNI